VLHLSLLDSCAQTLIFFALVVGFLQRSRNQLEKKQQPEGSGKEGAAKPEKSDKKDAKPEKSDKKDAKPEKSDKKGAKPERSEKKGARREKDKSDKKRRKTEN
jgi:hypothetical protein